jgi:hypothetical protein
MAQYFECFFQGSGNSWIGFSRSIDRLGEYNRQKVEFFEFFLKGYHGETEDAQ